MESEKEPLSFAVLHKNSGLKEIPEGNEICHSDVQNNQSHIEDINEINFRECVECGRSYISSSWNICCEQCINKLKSVSNIMLNAEEKEVEELDLAYNHFGISFFNAYNLQQDEDIGVCMKLQKSESSWVATAEQKNMLRGNNYKNDWDNSRDILTCSAEQDKEITVNNDCPLQLDTKDIKTTTTMLSLECCNCFRTFTSSSWRLCCDICVGILQSSDGTGNGQPYTETKQVVSQPNGDGDYPGKKGQISRNGCTSDKATVHQKQMNNSSRLKAQNLANYKMNSCKCCGKKFFSWFNLQRHKYYSVCRKGIKLNSSMGRCRNNIYRRYNYNMQLKNKGYLFKFRKKIPFWKQCAATDGRQGKHISGKHGQAADTLDMKTTRPMLSLECCNCLRTFTSSSFRLCCDKCVRMLRSSDGTGNGQPYTETEQEMSNVGKSSEGDKSSSDSDDSKHSSTCIYCGKEFSAAVNVRLHIQRGACKGLPNQEPKWKCPICEKRFKRRDCCVLHIKIHSKKNTSEENTGQKPLYVMSNVGKSSEGDKSSSDSKHSSTCIYCGKEFSAAVNVRLHIQRGACKGLPNQEPKWKCPICEKRFKRRDCCVLHIKIHSKKNTSEENTGQKPLYVMSNVGKSSEGDKSSSDSKHSSTCIYCGKEFSAAVNVRLHIQRGACKGLPNQEPKWKCPICEKRFKRRDCCVLHIKIHSKKNTSEENTGQKPLYVMSNVGKSSEGDKSSSDSKHSSTCIYCGKEFSAAVNVRLHIQRGACKGLPNQEPKWKCPICEKRFKRRDCCVLHIKIHSKKNTSEENTGQKPLYVMSNVGKSSEGDKSSSDSKHSSTCIYCGKEFSAAVNVRLHIQRGACKGLPNQEPKWKCPICEKRFKRRDCCVLHIKIHSKKNTSEENTGQKPLYVMSNVGKSSEGDKSSSDSKHSSTCIYCGKEFSAAVNVRLHIQRGACKGLPNQEPKWKCPICEKRFKRRDCCVLHIKIHSKKNTSEENTGQKPLYVMSNVGKSSEGDKSSSDSKHSSTCIYCGKEFSAAVNVRLHIQRGACKGLPNQEPKWKCPICEKRFKRRDCCVLHIKIHSKKNTSEENTGQKPLYVMSNVGKSSEGDKSSSDSKHSSTCIYCGKEFSAAVNVRLHIQRGACKGLPNQEPKWKCPICEKRFKRRDCCVLHIKIHSKKNTSEENTGQKPLYVMSNVGKSSEGDKSSSDSKHSSTCIYGGKEFSAAVNVRLHIQSGACKGLPNQEPKWKCPICEKRFKRRDCCVLHIKIHSKKNTSEENTGQKPLYEMSNVGKSSEGDKSSSDSDDSKHSSTCIYCGKEFSAAVNVRLHIQRGACKGLPNQEPKWKCPICEKRFKRRDCCVLHIKIHSKKNTSEENTGQKPLYVHDGMNSMKRSGRNDIQTQHPQSNSTDTSIVYKPICCIFNCSFCEEQFHSEIDLKNHNQFTHSEESTTESARKPENTKHRDDKRYKCKSCTSMFRKKHSLKVHCRMVHLSVADRSNEIRNCKMCGLNHKKCKPKKKFSKRRYVCEECGKSWERREGLKQHREHVHINARLYKCDVCDKAYNSRYYLENVHVRVHTSERPYMCATCGKTFATSVSLNIHTIYHADKKFQCSICGKKFFIKAGLQKHLTSHSDERAYKCKICEQTFKGESSLLRHILIHTGDQPYECKECGRKFNQNSSLKRHQRLHTGERPYQCHLCEKVFIQSISLTKHLATHKKNK